MTQPAGDYALRAENLTREFSGFRAVNDVTIDIPRGGVRTIIGPNGAGKTTFFNLLSGRIPPSAGRIVFDGRDITALGAYQRARLGIARSFQITNIFGRLSVRENVRLAVQAVYDGKVNFFALGSRLRDIDRETDELLEQIELTGLAATRAENLSHGDQRRLEIGLSLACKPSVLLLDEPLAGMSPIETHATVDLIQRFAAPADGKTAPTIVLVEHDIDVVMAISKTITVMQTGGILAVGTPEEIRNNDAVQKAYLGGLA